jgi:hypothetical protein
VRCAGSGVVGVENERRRMKKKEKNDLLSPCCDYIFKNIFAKRTRKRALISLLNSVLEGRPVIRDITIENPEIPRDFKNGKSVGLDIRATTDDTTKLQIDVQCQEDGCIANRSVFYQAKMQKNILKKNEEYDDLPNIISIWLVNYDETKRKYHTHEACVSLVNKILPPLQSSFALKTQRNRSPLCSTCNNFSVVVASEGEAIQDLNISKFRSWIASSRRFSQ